MEPVPETRVVLNQLVRHGETEIVAALADMTRLTAAIVPEIVGLSLGHVQHGLVFTLAASDVDTAVIDAAQYLGGGPCVEASTGAHTETWTLPEDPEELLDERRWAMYARASAAAGIASSLSLPLLSDGRAVGGVNLYASTPDAFDGHHEELAHALGTSASDAVSNADLFSVPARKPRRHRSGSRRTMTSSWPRGSSPRATGSASKRRGSDWPRRRHRPESRR